MRKYDFTMATLLNLETQGTKQKLLETAVNLIWENNYESVGIAQICEQAGVTKGAFYHYFQSKQSILLEYFARIGEQVQKYYQSLENKGSLASLRKTTQLPFPESFG